MSQTSEEAPDSVSPQPINLHFDQIEAEVLKLACGEARQAGQKHDRPTSAVADVIAVSRNSEEGLSLSVGPDFMLRLYNIVDSYVTGHNQLVTAAGQVAAERGSGLSNIVDQCSGIARRGVFKAAQYYRKHPHILENANWKVRMHANNLINKLDEKTLDLQTRRRFIMPEADQRELETCDIYDGGRSAALLDKIGQAILGYVGEEAAE